MSSNIASHNSIICPEAKLLDFFFQDTRGDRYTNTYLSDITYISNICGNLIILVILL